MVKQHKYHPWKAPVPGSGIDKMQCGWYNRQWATDRPKGRPYGAVAFLVKFIGKVSFHILKPFPKFHTEGR